MGAWAAWGPSRAAVWPTHALHALLLLRVALLFARVVFHIEGAAPPSLSLPLYFARRPQPVGARCTRCCCCGWNDDIVISEILFARVVLRSSTSRVRPRSQTNLIIICIRIATPQL